MEREIEIKLKSQEELATTIFELNIEKFKLNEQLQQYKQQIDEVKKYLEHNVEYRGEYTELGRYMACRDVLQILKEHDKESKND